MKILHRLKELVMKFKFVGLFVGLMLFGSVASAKKWSKLRIGVEGAYPPFSQVSPSGELSGFDIDIAKALCAELKLKCSLVPQDWDGMIPALQARKFDAIIASMSITEDRKKKVAFTNKYYRTPARFVRKIGSKVVLTKVGLKGKSVGIQRGTIHEKFIRGEFPDLQIKTYATQDEAYLDMRAGRVDLLIADYIALRMGFLETKEGKKYEFFGPEYTQVKYFGEGAGIAIRKKDQELVNLLNSGIDKIRKNGKYEAIRKKYFNFDIYGSSL